MNVLVYFASGQLGGNLNEQHIDMIIEEQKKGNHVVALNCDETIGLCMSNSGKSKMYCSLCKFVARRDFRRLMPAGVEQHWMKEFASIIDYDSLPTFEYSAAEELKTIEYKNVQVGFGVMSTYISLTRNMNPKITEASKKYFDALIREQVITLEILEYLQDKYNFGLVIFQNGRGAQLKPFLNFCQSRKIDFWCTEDFGRAKNYTNNFWNDYAHSMKSWYAKYQECWETSKDSIERKNEIAHSFFQNRRNAIAAGDKIYIKGQTAGLLPKDWDETKENIVIFNSSEDEFCSISKEWEVLKVFKSQLEGIISIVEHYKYDTSKHFTLRVHPNLKDLPYKYHKDLYKLHYDNLTVIPGWDKVSTYTLLDAADKVVVFGSTMGIEATYWKKPVILLGPSYYYDFGITYNPNDTEELWSLLETKELPTLYNDIVLKFGYFYMSDNHERTKNISIDLYIKKVNGHNLRCCVDKKLFGSNLLYAVVARLLWTRKIRNITAEYKHINFEEA